jgi:FeS assembly protein SufD
LADTLLKELQPTIPQYTPAEPVAFARKRHAAAAAVDSMMPPSDKKYTNWIRQKVSERFADKAIGTVTPTFEIRQADFDTGLKTIAIPLSKAITDWPEQVEPYLMGEALGPEEHYFSAIAGALYAEGAVIVVPKGTTAEIDLTYQLENGKLNAARTVIIVNEGATAEIFERSAATGLKQPTVFAHGVEVYVQKNARLKYSALQDWPETVTQLAAYRGRVDQDSRLDWLIGSFGGDFSQLRVESALAAAGAESDVHAIYYGDGSRHFDQELIANHLVGDTTSDTYARGVVGESAKAVYRGMIKIQRGAHGSAADQNGHAMLLANTAHADAIPGLEIDADDVTAGHGATVGQVDDEQLFYLMARGIPEEPARQMIIRGFFERLLGKVSSESTRDAFWKVIERKTGSA